MHAFCQLLKGSVWLEGLRMRTGNKNDRMCLFEGACTGLEIIYHSTLLLNI